MGREWSHNVKGVVSTLHQVMRCQSPNELYTIDIKGDQSQSRRCYKVESRDKEQRIVRRMKKGQIKRGRRTSPRGCERQIAIKELFSSIYEEIRGKSRCFNKKNN